MIKMHGIYNLVYSAYCNKTKQAEKQTINFLLMNTVICIFFLGLSLMSSTLQSYIFYRMTVIENVTTFAVPCQYSI